MSYDLAYPPFAALNETFTKYSCDINVAGFYQNISKIKKLGNLFNFIFLFLGNLRSTVLPRRPACVTVSPSVGVFISTRKYPTDVANSGELYVIVVRQNKCEVTLIACRTLGHKHMCL